MQERLRLVFVYSSDPCESDRLSGENWFLNFSIVLTFLAHRTFNGFLITYPTLIFGEIYFKVKLKNDRSLHVFARPRSSTSISCSNYLVICELYMTNNLAIRFAETEASLVRA